MNTTATGMWRTLPDGNGYYSNVPSFEERSKLGQEAFLRLLVEQLRSQDPFEPMNDREFIAQMAQFSSLEQITKLTTAMNSFVEFQMSGSLGQHSHMIGHQVYWQNEHDAGEGIVKSVSLKDGQIYAELENGQKILMNDIYRIETAPQPIEEDEEVEEVEEDGSDEQVEETEEE